MVATPWLTNNKCKMQNGGCQGIGNQDDCWLKDIWLNSGEVYCAWQNNHHWYDWKTI